MVEGRMPVMNESDAYSRSAWRVTVGMSEGGRGKDACHERK